MEQIQRYRNSISGPLLDRIDMHIEIPRMKQSQLRSNRMNDPLTTAEMQQRSIRAREKQHHRAGKPNSFMTNTELDKFCTLSDDDASLLENAIDKLGLSTRAYHRILRVARTIADLD